MKSKLTNRLVLCLVVMGFQNDPFVNLRPLESLEPWGANYRRGDVEAIKSSIKKFGFNSALRVKGSVVMAGNHAFKALKGGNTDAFYAKEGTSAKSQMLVDMHPDVARVVFKFGRVHHHVDYRPFKSNLLIRKPGTEIPTGIDDYGIELIRLKE